MLQIKILTVGKIKERWLEEAIEEYLKRLKPYAAVLFSLAKDDAQLLSLALKEPLLIALDIKGKALSSEQFSEILLHNLQKGGSRLAFIIGGAEGLPQGLLKVQQSISLSPLTFTHQMARLILIEQIYRAFEIEKGSPYHK